MAQTPVVLIGGATSDLLKGRGSLQDIDQCKKKLIITTKEKNKANEEKKKKKQVK
jgi:hypothetical protein